MPDYYAILWRALKKGDSENPQWRNSVFDRTREMLVDQLRARRPPLSNVEIGLHTAALQAAITTIQSEFVQSAGDDKSPQNEFADESPANADARPHAAPLSFNRVAWVAVAIVVAAVAAGGYAFVATRQMCIRDRTIAAPRPRPERRSSRCPTRRRVRKPHKLRSGSAPCSPLPSLSRSGSCR